MKNGMFLLLALLLSPMVHANQKAALEEGLYLSYQKSILSDESIVQKSFRTFSHFEQRLFVDALEDLINEGSLEALQTLEELNPFHYQLAEQLRVNLLKIKNRQIRGLPIALLREVESELASGSADLRVVYLLASYETDVRRVGHTKILELAKSYPEFQELNLEKRTASDEALRDLFYTSPELETVLNGKYSGGVKLFMFCRTNRLYPCLMLLRDARNDIVRNEDGTPWTQKALASSARGLPSYTRNGNTPAGIMSIDSVMPAADQQISFGKFRRLILEFIPRSQNEATMKSLLPETSHEEDWWKPGTVARDVGRNLFRIHGTGKINKDPESPYYPFMQTSGCIAQRENTYGDVTFMDQRVLLDKLMTAMDLDPVYANETKIKGLIYITEIDSEEAPVTVEDLYARGIQ